MTSPAPPARWRFARRPVRTWGTALLVFIRALATAGIALQAFGKLARPLLSTGLLSRDGMGGPRGRVAALCIAAGSRSGLVAGGCGVLHRRGRFLPG